MTYPTIDEVYAADQRKLGIWYRFLPSPGQSAVGTKNFGNQLRSEGHIMDVICYRFRAMGGMTPALSKEIGW
jgi:hypothetical protein